MACVRCIMERRAGLDPSILAKQKRVQQLPSSWQSLLHDHACAATGLACLPSPYTDTHNVYQQHLAK
jgi:hypothetical protein